MDGAAPGHGTQKVEEKLAAERATRITVKKKAPKARGEHPLAAARRAESLNLGIHSETLETQPLTLPLTQLFHLSNNPHSSL